MMINSFIIIVIDKAALFIIQKLRYVVTLLTLITNGSDTDYYLLIEDFKVS